MTYTTFVSVMNKKGITDVYEYEYKIAFDLYMSDIKAGECTTCFCEWLKNYNEYETDFIND